MAEMKDIVKVAVDAYHGNVEQYSVGQSMELLHKALIDANGGSTTLNYMLLRPQTTFRCWLSMRFSAHAPMRTLPKRTIRRSMRITLLEIRR